MAVIHPARDPADAAGMTMIVYLIWFFAGLFGVHRLVTGRVFTGVVQVALHGLGWLTIWLLGFGLLFWIPLGIWWVLDAFLIPGWLRR